jgi:hypothetical protein
MSYNTLKVNSNAPNSNGSITIPVSDLKDTTITNPQDGDHLDFDGGNTWINSPPGGGGVEYLRIGGKDSENTPWNYNVEKYGNMPVANSADVPLFNASLLEATLYIHDPAPVVSSGLSSVVFHDNGNNWIHGITPPLGKYIIELQFPIAPYWGSSYTTTDNLGVIYNDGSIVHRATSRPAVGGTSNAGIHRQGPVARGYVDFTSEAYTLEFECRGYLSHAYIFHNYATHFLMIKVG